MKITYSGIRSELSPRDRASLESKVQDRMAMLSKIVERRGEKDTHLILNHERHLYHAELTMNLWDHGLVAVGSNRDPFEAISAAVAKLEKQAMKLRTKWRDNKRTPEAKSKGVAAAVRETAAPVPAPKAAPKKKVNGKAAAARIYRVDQHEDRKPLTVDEAMLEIDGKQDYFVFRNAENAGDGVSVLIRRKDGHFDLIES
jgi:putative sigma-54 modulation protein